MKRTIAWFAENHVAANLLMLLFVLGGITTIFSIPIRTFPDINAEVVTIAVDYPGAAPEEVEEGVCVRVEEEVDGVDGIERLTSSSTEGACAVTAELIPGADQDRVLADIKNRVDAITTFPDDAEKPIVSQPVVSRPVIDIAISGISNERTLKELGEQVRDEISMLDGITRVELNQTRPYEISIEVPEESLRRHGMTFSEVVEAVRRSSLDLPGGSIKADGGEILLRSKGQSYRGSEFEELVLMTAPDGTRVRLGDVANVRDGFEDVDLVAAFDGAPVAVVRVFRVGDQDALEVAGAVKAYVANKRDVLPAGVDLTVWQDSTDVLRGRIDILLRNGFSGFLLVFAILALFLRLRLAFWVALGVPVSFAAAIWLFPALGISIDMISLFSFILVLGIVVDDAIVVGEAVHTEQEGSEGPLAGAIRGTQGVCVPVIFGVLTSIVAFAPLLVVPGTMGQVFYPMGLVVILCLAFSLLESQLILPAHLGHTRHAKADPDATGPFARFQRAVADGLARFVEQTYLPFLERAVAWRYTTLATGLSLLIVALALVASRLPFSFFPAIEGDFITAQITMPAGVPIERTEEAVQTLRTAFEDVKREVDAQHAPSGGSLFEHTLSTVGDQPFRASSGPPSGGQRRAKGSHVGELVVELVPAEQRDVSTQQVEQMWRERVPPIPEAVEVSFASDLFSAGDALNIQLQGPNVEDLRQAATRLKAELAKFPGVSDIADSFRSGKREVKLSVLPSAEPLGVTLQDLARQVRQAFYGEEAQRIQRGRDDIRVMVRYPEAQRRSLGDLENMRIRTRDGSEVPFGIVARARPGTSYTTIRRADRQRVVNVTAAVDLRRTTENAVLATLRAEVLPGLMSDYPGLSYSVQGAQREQARAMGGLLSWYAIALFGVYALLAIPLRSYAQPLIVMAVIPFGLIGAVFGHMLLAIPTLSFLSALGFVALSGVVVNDSLIFVHTVNSVRATGRSMHDAVVETGRSRFRPIFLTSLTTFMGLTPLMLEQSMQAQFLIPMAVSLAFGVVVSTFVTLLIVPSLYLILEDLTVLFSRVRRPRRAHASADAPGPNAWGIGSGLRDRARRSR